MHTEIQTTDTIPSPPGGLWHDIRDAIRGTEHDYTAGPIGRAIFSRVGLFVMLTELALFAPVFVYALWPRPMRGGVPDDA